LIFYILASSFVVAYDRVAPVFSPVIATSFYSRIDVEGQQRVEIIIRRGISEVKLLAWNDGDRVFADFYILDDLRVYNQIFIPLTLDSLFYTAFENIVDATKYSVNWDYLLPETVFEDLSNTKNMIEQIRNHLEFIDFSSDYSFEEFEDSGFSQAGSVNNQIKVNPFTFVKWIADGLYFAKSGNFLDTSELLEKKYNYRGNQWSDRVETEANPFLALDWSRNIAHKFLLLENENALYEGADVRELIDFEFYKEDVGFSVKDLRRVLYNLAVIRSNYFFIGAISHLSGDENNYRTYQHIVALFPYIDSNGSFEIVVFESGKESSIQELEFRYKKNDYFIHLVEVRLGNHFFLSDFENLPIVDR
ncbi:MAG: hypothetical protein JXR63_03665, partial [Spirochaetales bacterium]|nr:hypothetical protein [Spirochaetales bacterium]